jgi:signal transduction histidine kinase
MGQSLRGKIAWAYVATGLLVFALVLAQYVALRGIERGLERGDIVAGLLHDSLEMRRFEKKFYADEDPADLQEARRHATVALERLNTYGTEIEQLASPAERQALGNALIRYLGGLESYPALIDRQRAAAVEGIRQAGHEVSSLTKVLSQRDHDALTARVRLSDQSLIAAGIIVMLLLVIGGYWLARRILSPIASVEMQLRAIGAGDRSQLESPSLDRELVSFTRVFNTMLGELDERQAALRRSERLAALGILVSGVAHELNNPLGNISTSLQLVAEEGVGGDAQLVREWLQQAESEVARAQNIVRGLLHYAHQQPRGPKKVECLPLARIVTDSVDLIRSTLPADRVTLEIPAELEIAVDPARLQQVLVNLLRNAFEAGGAAARVFVRAEKGRLAALRPGPDAHAVGALLTSGAPDAPVVRLTVEDDGPGIAPDALDHVFEPFFRARTDGGGSGLGLFVAQEIVQEHGGAIGVADSARGGARFTVWLPCPCRERRGVQSP